MDLQPHNIYNRIETGHDQRFTTGILGCKSGCKNKKLLKKKHFVIYIILP